MVIRVFSGWSVRRGLNRDLVHCPWLCCRDQFTRFTSHLWTTFLYLFWMYWILQASLLLHGSMGYSVHLVQNYATKFSIMIYKYIILLSKKKKDQSFPLEGLQGLHSYKNTTAIKRYWMSSFLPFLSAKFGNCI